jgi:hypothetical protein
MAVKIPIVTVFNGKGLTQAQYQLRKVQANVNNLKRNFAVAGAAIAGFGLVVGKSVQSLARIEQINAQTEAVLKSMGQTAGVTSKEIQDLAGNLENLTATEAETIQEGANLLLTFRNVKNEAGAGNDIFNQTVTTMVDLARAMGTDASGEAIRLGKALNDPVKGISALTRVGVSFTQQQKDQIKALQDSGDIMEAQKIILAELQAQFGGSGAAFAQTFTGQLQLLGHELGTVGEEATMAVMPALQGMVQELRDLIPVIGPQLKAAIESVDWKGLVKTLVDLVTWFTQNATTILTVVTAVWALNTAYNLGRVAIGLYNAGAVIFNTTMGATAAATGVATGALKLFRIALMTTGIGALVVALGFIIQGATEVDSAYRRTTPTVTSWGNVVLKSGENAQWAADRYGVVATAVDAYKSSAITTNQIGFSAHTTNINQIENAWNKAIDAKNRYGNSGAMWGGAGSGITTPPSGRGVIPPVGGGNGGKGGAGNKKTGFLANLTQQAKLARKEARLIGLGLSEGLASAITSGGLKQTNKLLTKIKDSAKFATKLQNKFNRTAAGQAELQRVADQAAQAAAEASAEAQRQAEELQRVQEEAARKEAEALAERERVYNSFLDSVKSTFGQIKESILGAFDITRLGGSTNSIIRNMKKLLESTRSFSANIQQLSAMGLNPELLAQVIQAGPMAGARLAASLVAGGAGAIAEIGAAYSEFGGYASAIATTGTEARFGTEQQQTIYNINVDGGVGSGATIGKAIVDAIKAYERTSGAVWQGA